MGQVLPIIGAGLGLFGAIQQQQQASAAQAVSREALEMQKQLIEEFKKELEELRPHRRALREMARQRLGQAPLGWNRWTSDVWRLRPYDLPPPPQPTPPPSQNQTWTPPPPFDQLNIPGTPWYREPGPYERGESPW